MFAMFRHLRDSVNGSVTLPTWQPWHVCLVFLFLQAGCALTTQDITTGRTSLEQRLVVRSIERAVDQLDLQRFAGYSLSFELVGLSDDEAYAEALIKTRLKKHGAQLVEAGTGQVDLAIFAPAIGIDHTDTLIGIPALSTGVFPIPEVAIYKQARGRSHSELQVYAYDTQSGELVPGLSVTGIGEAHHTRYVALIVIRFAQTDVERRLEPSMDSLSVEG